MGPVIWSSIGTGCTVEFVLSQSFSAASTRVCQPSPVARKACNTSFERRMVVDTFVGDFCGPRARMPKDFCSASGSTSPAGLKVRISAAVNSRTSPSLSMRGMRLFIVFDFPWVGLAKTDDPNANFNRREAQNMQPGIQETHRYVSQFGVGLTRITFDDGTVKIEIRCLFQ